MESLIQEDTDESRKDGSSITGAESTKPADESRSNLLGEDDARTIFVISCSPIKKTRYYIQISIKSKLHESIILRFFFFRL